MSVLDLLIRTTVGYAVGGFEGGVLITATLGVVIRLLVVQCMR